MQMEAAIERGGRTDVNDEVGLAVRKYDDA
jgi:hypothetical protein